VLCRCWGLCWCADVLAFFVAMLLTSEKQTMLSQVSHTCTRVNSLSAARPSHTTTTTRARRKMLITEGCGGGVRRIGRGGGVRRIGRGGGVRFGQEMFPGFTPAGPARTTTEYDWQGDFISGTGTTNQFANDQSDQQLKYCCVCLWCAVLLKRGNP
jgi:hypothetical protein